MLLPILEYGDVLFDNCGEILSDLLESVQIKAARACTHQHYTYSKITWKIYMH